MQSDPLDSFFLYQHLYKYDYHYILLHSIGYIRLGVQYMSNIILRVLLLLSSLLFILLFFYFHFLLKLFLLPIVFPYTQHSVCVHAIVRIRSSAPAFRSLIYSSIYFGLNNNKKKRPELQGRKKKGHVTYFFRCSHHTYIYILFQASGRRRRAAWRRYIRAEAATHKENDKMEKKYQQKNKER